MSKKRTTKLSIVIGICIVILTLCLSLGLTACSDKNGKPDDSKFTASSLSDFTLSSDNKTILGLSKQNVTSVIIPAGIENIGESAFSGQDSIKSVTMSDSVTSIDERAFEGCYALMSVTISSGMTEIGDYAFSECYKLVEVYNKSSLNIVKGSEDNGYVAYYAKDVYTSDFVSKLSTTNDGYTVYTNENVKSLICYTGTKTQLTIPNDITQINAGAFFLCSDLTNVTIGDHVTSIGNCAFYGCNGLTSITIPDITTIGEWAFADCQELANVVLGENLTTISDGAFYNCYSIISIIYDGTKEDWDAIEKGEAWDWDAGDYTLYCSDGDYDKDGNKIN